MSLPICPTTCNATPPTVDFSLCNPVVNNGQIAKIYFTTIGNPLINWASEIEWDSRLDNDAAGAANIRTLIVVGDKPVPGKTEKEISLGRKISGVKQFTVAFDIDETNQTNYDAMRQIECGGNFLVWYETRDGLLYGSTAGIEAKISIDEAIPRAYTDLILFPGTLAWESKFHPERITSPITDETGDQF